MRKLHVENVTRVQYLNVCVRIACSYTPEVILEGRPTRVMKSTMFTTVPWKRAVYEGYSFTTTLKLTCTLQPL